jgi:hypothetical protein
MNVSIVASKKREMDCMVVTTGVDGMDWRVEHALYRRWSFGWICHAMAQCVLCSVAVESVTVSVTVAPLGHVELSQLIFLPIWMVAIIEVRKLKEHTDSVFQADYSHDGSQVASASWDTLVKIWDTSARFALLESNELDVAHHCYITAHGQD